MRSSFCGCAVDEGLFCGCVVDILWMFCGYVDYVDVLWMMRMCGGGCVNDVDVWWMFCGCVKDVLWMMCLFCG